MMENIKDLQSRREKLEQIKNKALFGINTAKSLSDLEKINIDEKLYKNILNSLKTL